MIRKSLIKKIARAGLIAKGVVYVILGALAFMAAFEIGGQSESNVNRKGAFEAVQNSGGMPLLAVLAAGLICYAIWRGFQTFSNWGDDEKKLPKRLRYFFSGLAYAGVAFTAIKMMSSGNKNNGSQNQQLTAELLTKPFGQILVGVAALIIAGMGVYQIYYGLSEKYKKHLQKLSLGSRVSSLLLRSGKIGYIARGVVWLLISYLFMRAAMEGSSSKAGDSGKAFQFLENNWMGSYLLGAMGLGVIAYGAFNFIRARYEKFN